MQLLLNGETAELPDGITITEVLEHYGRSDSGVAVAVNLSVVPREQYGTTALSDGDRVDVVTAVGGG